MVYSILVVLSFEKGGDFYVLGVVLFFEKRCQKRNRREIKKARKSKQSLAQQLNECVIEVKGSCEERQSLRAFLPMPMPFSGPLVVVWRLSETEISDFSVANGGEFDCLYCDSVFE
jgi:hypothetical protein